MKAWHNIKQIEIVYNYNGELQTHKLKRVIHYKYYIINCNATNNRKIRKKPR